MNTRRPHPPLTHPRRPHRKRSSLSRLSTDTTTTTTTLPEYRPCRPVENVTSDRPPPDYNSNSEIDSADDADEETDEAENSATGFSSHSQSLRCSPQRKVRRTISAPFTQNQTQTQRRRLPPSPSGNSKRRLGDISASPSSATFVTSLPTSVASSTSTRTPVLPPPDDTDAYLDTLLERSVHALEMSNALLHSSMATQTSLTSIFSTDSARDRSLEVRAKGLSDRVRETRDVQRGWAVDLDEIRREVDELFNEEGNASASSARSRRSRRHSSSRQESGSFSPSSLPSSSSVLYSPTRRTPSHSHSHLRQPTTRRPSTDLRIDTTARTNSAYLELGTDTDRGRYIAPPPRAITQYVGSSADPDTIMLPSTLGLRASPSAFLSPSMESPMASPGRFTFTGSVSDLGARPVVVDRVPEPTTPAYNLLSSFVVGAASRRSGSGSRSSSRASSPRRSPLREVSVPSTGAPVSATVSAFLIRARAGSARRVHSAERTKREDVARVGSSSSSLPNTPLLGLSMGPAKRPSNSPGSGTPNVLTGEGSTHGICETIEEVSCPSSGSSSDENAPRAKLTVLSLRKILDEQPSPSPSSLSSSSPSTHKRPQNISPIALSKPPSASSGTSTATASVSRMFSKGGVHTSSAKPPESPRVSSLKRSGSGGSGEESGNVTPRTPEPGAGGGTRISEMLSPPPFSAAGVVRALSSKGLNLSASGRSTPGSGSSTPKRISFAELPESYAASRPPGSPSGFGARKKAKGKKRARAKGHRSEGSEGSLDEGGGGGQWWTKWLALPLGPSSAGEGGLGLGLGLGMGGSVVGMNGSGVIGLGRNEGRDERRGWSGRPDDWAV